MRRLPRCRLRPAELPQGVRFDRNGSFRVGDAEFYIQNYSPSWTPAANGSWKELKTKLGKSGLSLSAVMRVGTQSAAVTEAVTPTGENAFRLKFDAKFAEKATVNALHGVFVIPAGEMTVTVDGKPVVLPAEYREMTVYGNSKAKELRFTAAGGRRNHGLRRPAEADHSGQSQVRQRNLRAPIRRHAERRGR